MARQPAMRVCKAQAAERPCGEPAGWPPLKYLLIWVGVMLHIPVGGGDGVEGSAVVLPEPNRKAADKRTGHLNPIERESRLVWLAAGFRRRATI